MTDVTETTDDLNTPSELDVLRERCKFMGITYSNNSNVDTLRKKIEDKLAETTTTSDSDESEIQKANPLAGVDTPQKRKTLRQHLYDENMKLIRVRISCMDPKKSDLPGEIFTVANEHLGTVRKFVPFGEQTDDGFYIPYCIYKMMESRQFLQVTTRRDKKTGHITVTDRWIREFSLDVLPQGTPEELAALAAEQAASGRLKDQ